MPANALSAARFPSLGRDAGHYESFYLELADPERPCGVWIRHTVFKRPGEAPPGISPGRAGAAGPLIGLVSDTIWPRASSR
jgi:hypothetical protein